MDILNARTLVYLREKKVDNFSVKTSWTVVVVWRQVVVVWRQVEHKLNRLNTDHFWLSLLAQTYYLVPISRGAALLLYYLKLILKFHPLSSSLTPWRNGSASDSRSEGCVFKSRRGQLSFYIAHNNILTLCWIVFRIFSSCQLWKHTYKKERIKFCAQIQFQFVWTTQIQRYFNSFIGQTGVK